ncbi:ras association domain-containing protein 4 isoform X1 [Eumetopias jubatus]|uniref:ras association domain-containing protein 4 isoform X1 n=1 Tax=Eumetopias jubatus TaxID=34886 RepID=UPI001015DDDB|nr:ras association domain-containing protein 4 isoform X1 [Eumetopias jubatus]XP_027954363.1 ras association domain-containing protein 4 isoform X1 [Eumetopias jubatus]
MWPPSLERFLTRVDVLAGEQLGSCGTPDSAAPSQAMPLTRCELSGGRARLRLPLVSPMASRLGAHRGSCAFPQGRTGPQGGEEEGALVIEGLLNIAWGLRRPIRLQIQDDRERVHLSSASWTPGQPGCPLKEPLLQDGRVPAQEPRTQTAPRAKSSRDSSEPLEEDEETPQLMRTKSDAACVIQRRPRARAPGEAQRIRRHRFSINGHFYNHKTSVFTPAYGSVTNVRVNSTMTTVHVLTLLLNKFRVENGPSEFALYIVHESGERTKLKDCEYPLISRILHGPCEKIARIFLMEADLGEEVPHDVAQYIKFEMPVLDSFVEKLKEEEEREIIKLTMKFQALRLTMLQRLEQLVEAK